MTVVQELTIRNKVGLHARPAALFVTTAAGFKAKIFVENLSKKTPAANGKSLLSILSIGVQMNDLIKITVEGEDERSALEALTDMVENNFGEELES